MQHAVKYYAHGQRVERDFNTEDFQVYYLLTYILTGSIDVTIIHFLSTQFFSLFIALFLLILLVIFLVFTLYLYRYFDLQLYNYLHPYNRIIFS